MNTGLGELPETTDQIVRVCTGRADQHYDRRRR